MKMIRFATAFGDEFEQPSAEALRAEKGRTCQKPRPDKMNRIYRIRRRVMPDFFV